MWCQETVGSVGFEKPKWPAWGSATGREGVQILLTLLSLGPLPLLLIIDGEEFQLFQAIEGMSFPELTDISSGMSVLLLLYRLCRQSPSQPDNTFLFSAELSSSERPREGTWRDSRWGDLWSLSSFLEEWSPSLIYRVERTLSSFEPSRFLQLVWRKSSHDLSVNGGVTFVHILATLRAPVKGCDEGLLYSLSRCGPAVWAGLTILVLLDSTEQRPERI